MCCRDADQPTADHGQVRPGPVRAVQPGDPARRPSRRHQQEAVAGDHQGVAPTLFHHVSGLHAPDTVSTPIYYALYVGYDIHFF